MDILAKLEDRQDKELFCGVGVGPGWFALLEKLDAQLAKIDPKYQVQQVKQKFGLLRFYAKCSNEADSDTFFKVIDDAEEESGKICEDCGVPGKTHIDRVGWISCRCDKCWDSQQ